MEYEKLNLRNEYNSLKYDTTLEILSMDYVDQNPNKFKPAIIILGGGGYCFVSKREKDPVAISYLKEGFTIATLDYTTKPNVIDNDPLYPHIYLELMAAFDYLSKNAKRFNIDKNNISLIGFSAGGHFAMSYGFMYKNEDLLNMISVDKKNLKPSNIILGYPVCSLKQSTHEDTVYNITNNDRALIDLLSYEGNISNDYPPTFMWNTIDDAVVPEINVRMLKDELDKFNVRNQAIQFPHGEHGLSTLDDTNTLNKNYLEELKEIKTWVKLSVDFINKK